MIEKIDRRVSMTKRFLKDALIQLLNNKDIYHISIRELCELADVNRSTFYKYYGSQFDLLADMESDMIEFIQKTVSKNKAPQKIIEAMCEYLEDNLQFVRLIVNNNIDPTFAQKVFSLDVIKNIIKQRAGNKNETELEYAYVFITSGAFAEVSVWLNKEKRESPKQLGEIIEKQINLLFR